MKVRPAADASPRKAYRYAAHKKKRKLKLIADTTVVFSEHGIRPLTIDRIAEELGLPKPSIYRYFKSKEELVVAVLESASNDLLKADLEESSDDWRKKLRSALHFISHKPHLFEVLYKHAAHDPEYVKYFDAYFRDIASITRSRLSLIVGERPTTRISEQFIANNIAYFIFSATSAWIDDGLWNVDRFHDWLVRAILALVESWVETEST